MKEKIKKLFKKIHIYLYFIATCYIIMPPIWVHSYLFNIIKHKNESGIDHLNLQIFKIYRMTTLITDISGHTTYILLASRLINNQEISIIFLK